MAWWSTYGLAVAARTLAKFVEGLDQHANIALHLRARACRVLLAGHAGVGGVDGSAGLGEVSQVLLLGV